MYNIELFNPHLVFSKDNIAKKVQVVSLDVYHWIQDKMFLKHTPSIHWHIYLQSMNQIEANWNSTGLFAVQE